MQSETNSLKYTQLFESLDIALDSWPITSSYIKRIILEHGIPHGPKTLRKQLEKLMGRVIDPNKLCFKVANDLLKEYTRNLHNSPIAIAA